MHTFCLKETTKFPNCACRRFNFKQRKVVLFEIKVGLLEREKQTKFNSQISAKSNIRFSRNYC